MKWRDREGSSNVEDRRDQSGGGDSGGFRFPFPRGGSGSGGGRFPFPMPGGGGGGGGMSIITIVIVVGLMLLFGIDPRILLGGGGPGGGTQIELPGGGSLDDILRPGRTADRGDGTTLPFPRRSEPQAPEDTTGGSVDDVKKFVSVVLVDTEAVWTKVFAAAGKTYDKPALVLYRGRTRSGCGTGVAQMGPFYCPLDGKVYLDASFFQQLSQRFRSPGDFAQAYVIAHEVGHHVQTLLGITEKVERAKRNASEEQSNAIQVRMELQADCLAGMWANHANAMKNILDAGDIDEALGAASAIGDDTMMKRETGMVVPENFTHGTSEQRVRWFRKGFDTGQFAACDTFKADSI